MKLHIVMTGAFLALTACGGSGADQLGPAGSGGGSDDGGGTGGGAVESSELPVDAGSDTCANSFTCSGDVTSVTFNGTDTLTLSDLPFDDNPKQAVYNLIGQINGFDVFENTDPATFNRYLALHNTSENGELTLGTASIQGYQEFGYTGSWFQLNDVATTIPSLGLVSYNGDYAGLMTFIGSGDLYTTRGDLQMQVDFTDSVLKGFIFNRTYDTDPVGPGGLNDNNGTLPTLVLNDTAISGGSFSGTVNSYDGSEVLESGTYQGFFGGSDASAIGGLVQAINPEFSGDPDDTDDTNDLTSRDLGTFVGCVGTCPSDAP